MSHTEIKANSCAVCLESPWVSEITSRTVEGVRHLIWPRSRTADSGNDHNSSELGVIIIRSSHAHQVAGGTSPRSTSEIAIEAASAWSMSLPRNARSTTEAKVWWL